MRAVRTSALRRTLALLSVFAVCSACSGDDDSASPSSTASSTASSTTTTAAVTAGEPLQLGQHDAVRVEVLGDPDWLVADESFLYVKLSIGVARVEAATGAVVNSVETSERGACQGIGVGFDSVWSCDGADVLRLDPETLEPVSRIPAGKAASQGHLAAGFDRVWVLQGDGSTLAAIDPATDAVGEPVPLPVRGTDLAVGTSGVWIFSALDDAVVVLDPASGTVLNRIDGFEEPRGLSIGDDVVWVGDGAAVHRIDEATVTIVSSIPGGVGRTGAVAADDTGVWVRRGPDVTHIDAASGAVDDSFALDLDEPSPGDILVAFDALWTAASEHASLFRIMVE
jgi:hypothetical protein